MHEESQRVLRNAEFNFKTPGINKKKSIIEFRTQEAIKMVDTRANLPHEAFHYFYETNLGKEEYEGPRIGELLAMAVRGKQKRFGDKDPYYA